MDNRFDTRSSSRIVFVAACTLALSACTEAIVPTQAGTLSVAISGLPQGVLARVEVSGQGFAVDVTENTVLTSLQPGAYAITADEVCANTVSNCPAVDRFRPGVAAATVEVVSGETSAIQIAYRADRIESTFVVDDEGWTTSGDASALRRLAGESPHGFYLEADDLQQGVTWFWEAPTKFLGNVGHLLGGRLDVTLRQSSITNQFEGRDVILVGPDFTLYYVSMVLVGTDWTDIVVPLTTSDGGWFTAPGESADESDLAAVLSDLKQLRVRGEFRTGADTGGLASFALSVHDGVEGN